MPRSRGRSRRGTGTCSGWRRGRSARRGPGRRRSSSGLPAMGGATPPQAPVPAAGGSRGPRRASGSRWRSSRSATAFAPVSRAISAAWSNSLASLARTRWKTRPRTEMQSSAPPVHSAGSGRRVQARDGAEGAEDDGGQDVGPDGEEAQDLTEHVSWRTHSMTRPVAAAEGDRGPGSCPPPEGRRRRVRRRRPARPRCGAWNMPTVGGQSRAVRRSRATSGRAGEADGGEAAGAAARRDVEVGGPVGDGVRGEPLAAAFPRVQVAVGDERPVEGDAELAAVGVPWWRTSS
ncbi:hypothetical protein STANM309S_03685 [Streptomyces tanashiensis]